MLGTSRQSIAAISASIFALTLSACGGGGGGGASLPVTTAQPPSQAPPSAQATAKIVVTIPPKKTVGKYVSASTQSMTIGLVSGTATTPLSEVDLTLGSPGCAGVAGGGIVCTVLVEAPLGADTFSVTAYDQTGAKGNVLSTGNIAATLVAGTPTSVPLVLGGVAVAATVVLGTSNFPVGSPGSVAVTVDAYDAGGNVIIGPGAFATPITLTISGDPYGTLSLSSATIASPGQIETLNYNGGSVVAAQITPSGTGLTGALNGAAFGASGLNLNSFLAEYNLLCSGTPAQGSLQGYGVAALSNGTAAVLFGSVSPPSCATVPFSIGIVNPNGLAGNLFAGDTSDPYNPGAVPPAQPSVTWIHSMNTGFQINPGSAYSGLAAGPNNTVYYAAQFTTTSLPPQANCAAGGSAISGLIGQLDPSTGTTTETILHGSPYQIKSDSNGNVYFIEFEGTCMATGANLLDGSPSFEYAVGNITGGTVTETPLSALGITGTVVPGDIAVAPDGSIMYVADHQTAGRIIVIPINSGTFAAATVASEPLANNPNTIAAGDDGSLAWFTADRPGSAYYWGYAPSGSAITTATMKEQGFVSPGFTSNSLTYADGSYFAAGSTAGTGIARMASLTSAPIVSSIPVPFNPQFTAISAGGGFIWAVDDVSGGVYSLQYGAPKAGIVNPAARHASVAPRNTKPHHR